MDIALAQSNLSLAGVHRITNMMIMGGVLQIVYYCTIVYVGNNFEDEILKPEYGAVYYLSFFCFVGAIMLYDASLISLGRALGTPTNRWIKASMGIAAFSFVMPLVGLVAATLFDVFFGIFGGVAQISSLLAITLMAVGCLRGRNLPRPISLGLLAVGLSTFPVIMIFAIPMGIPMHYTSELPFAAEGLCWIGVAWLLRRSV